MKQILLLLTFVLTTFLGFGQTQHLVPARDFNQHEGILKEYYDNISTDSLTVFLTFGASNNYDFKRQSSQTLDWRNILLAKDNICKI